MGGKRPQPPRSKRSPPKRPKKPVVVLASSSDEQESSEDDTSRKSLHSKRVRRKSASSVEEVQETELADEIVEAVTTSDGQSMGHDEGGDTACDSNLIDNLC